MLQWNSSLKLKGFSFLSEIYIFWLLILSSCMFRRGRKWTVRCTNIWKECFAATLRWAVTYVSSVVGLTLDVRSTVVVRRWLLDMKCRKSGAWDEFSKNSPLKCFTLWVDWSEGLKTALNQSILLVLFNFLCFLYFGFSWPTTFS